MFCKSQIYEKLFIIHAHSHRRTNKETQMKSTAVIITQMMMRMIINGWCWGISKRGVNMNVAPGLKEVEDPDDDHFGHKKRHQPLNVKCWTDIILNVCAKCPIFMFSPPSYLHSVKHLPRAGTFRDVAYKTFNLCVLPPVEWYSALSQTTRCRLSLPWRLFNGSAVERHNSTLQSIRELEE
jgi:hypothetical protein